MKTTISKFKLFPVILLSVFVLSSCEIHIRDNDHGLPGDAYISLEWSSSEPEYIDVDSRAIPSTFYWNEYYHISPGWYEIYYDGEFWNGDYWEDYAWEMEFEVWVQEGEYGYYGRDGADNYFTVECNPRGPYYHEDIGFKSTSLSELKLKEGVSLLTEDEQEIEIEQVSGSFKMKVKYKKVEKRVR